jgi:NADH:ubiquinone oxidoreductase subunit 2 (subunit N)
MRPPEDDPAAATSDLPARLAVALAAVAVLALGLWPEPVYDLTRHVYSSLQSLASLRTF